MAVSKRNTASVHAQEPPLTIARVALYARVSTLNGQDPEMQLSELREYASRRGWTITSEYVDQGVSGSKESRPQLNQLMADAHRRKFDAVLVWKIDRFGRSLKHLVNALADGPLREASNLFPVVLAGNGVKFPNDRNVKRAKQYKEQNHRKDRGRKKMA
jgi:hypothetical protein